MVAADPRATRRLPIALGAALVVTAGCHAISGLNEFDTAEGAGGGGGMRPASSSSASTGGGAGGGGGCDLIRCDDPSVRLCMSFEDDLQVRGQLQGTAMGIGSVGYVDGPFGRALRLQGSAHVEVPSDPILAPCG